MIASQLYIFAISIICGAIVALIYDILRAKRKNFRTGAIMVHIEDFIFWIIASLILFVVAFNINDGDLRGFIFIGFITGIVLYMALLSKFILKALSFLMKALKYPFSLSARIMSKPVKYLGAISGVWIARVKIWNRIFKNYKTKL